MNQKPNGGPGNKSFLTFGALGSALCGGLCLGIFLGLHAAQQWFGDSITQMEKLNESQATQAKSLEVIAETAVRMEARAEADK